MTKKPLVLMIDDDSFFQDSWRKSLGDSVVFRGFDNPFEFEEAIDKDDLLLSANCIIVDFDFGNENAGELDIVDFLRSKNYIGKIFLCSIYEDFGEYDGKIRKDFDFILKKKSLTWHELSKIIAKS